MERTSISFRNLQCSAQTNEASRHKLKPVFSLKGFTLIELLVVIAIIAILVAIVMPSLSKGMDMARSAVCLTHERQYGLAINMYLEDNKGFFPGRRDPIAIQPVFKVFLPYYGGDPKLLLQCPSAPVNNDVDLVNPWSVQYGMPKASRIFIDRAVMIENNATYPKTSQRDKIPNPSQTCLVGETRYLNSSYESSGWGFDWFDGENLPASGGYLIWDRHDMKRSSNYLFLDGRCESIIGTVAMLKPVTDNKKIRYTWNTNE